MSDTLKYTSQQIVVLEGLEPVRKRPAMYIGSTDITGLHHCLNEIIDNSIDEALAGFAKNIWVIVHPDNSVTVADDGREFPSTSCLNTKKSALEVIMTTLHSGGKFEGTAYKVSGGLHGVGASCVNALSILCQVEVRRDKKIYSMEFSRGKVKSPLTTITKTQIPLLEKFIPSSVSGTTVTFYPDRRFLKKASSLIPKPLSDRLRTVPI